MSERIIKAEPISVERFAPYGDVIHTAGESQVEMNLARFERYHDLARIDVADKDGRPALSIARCRIASTFPLRIDTVERHPHGSQAFIPRSPFRFVVVVAPPGDGVDAGELVAFVTDGTQGINYRKGVWHMPMIALQTGQEFLIVDRYPAADNCDEIALDEPVLLTIPDTHE